MNIAIDTKVLGSFLVLPIKQTTGFDPFDFGDLSAAQTMMLRLDDLGLATVFDDARGARAFIVKN
jgi:hypothetical protein